MAKVNIGGFVEFECSEFNEVRMRERRLNNSTGLKISVFLNEISVQEYYETSIYVGKDKNTTIQCRLLQKDICQYSGLKCLYANLSLKSHKTYNLN